MIDPGPEGAATGRRTLGVVGTLVWDTIHRRDIGQDSVEEWGGIGYSLEALSAAVPEGWEVRPIVKVGRDLIERARGYLGTIPGVDPRTGIRAVDAPNNRVELHYADGGRRTEHLSGGVPPWTAGELLQAVRGCEALYVNFISGFEMDLEAARGLREGFDGPIWADLHSLFLGVGEAGLRVPQPLAQVGEWLRSFHAVQMNESEFELMAAGGSDPNALAARAVGRDLGLIVVTLGDRGAAYVRDSELPDDPLVWPGRWTGLTPAGQALPGRVEGRPHEGPGDPTGCGDVWGATTFARLLAGDGLDGAIRRANRMAALNVGHRGAGGLHHHLQGRVHPGRDR